MVKRVHSPMADSFVKTDLFIIKCYVRLATPRMAKQQVWHVGNKSQWN